MNPATGTFITQDTYSGTIFDPTSLHKYLYANANPVTYSDPSGYMSAENSLDFYQQAWITVEQASQYETKLICSMSNEVSYDYNVMQIGREIIHQLRNTGLEYALTYVLEPYVGPNVARLIANGIVSGLDMALSSRNKNINDNSSIINGGECPVSELSDSELAALGLKRHPDGSIRDLSGHFAGGSGTIPGTPAVEIAEQYFSEKGINVLGKEISVRSKVDGTLRKYDLVIKNNDGSYVGIEIKSGTASRSKSQKKIDGELTSVGGLPTVGKKLKMQV